MTVSTFTFLCDSHDHPSLEFFTFQTTSLFLIFFHSGQFICNTYKLCLSALDCLLDACLTRCDPMDCSPPGSSVHGIIPVRMLEWVAIPSSRRYSQPRWNPCLLRLPHCRQILYRLSHEGSLRLSVVHHLPLSSVPWDGYTKACLVSVSNRGVDRHLYYFRFSVLTSKSAKQWTTSLCQLSSVQSLSCV